MQNVQEPMSSPRVVVDIGKTSVESPSITGNSSSELTTKKFRDSQPQEIECRVSRVTSDRDRTLTSNSSYQCDKQLKTSIIDDKYQLFEQVEGSSLYRCVDIHTKEELVCKVSYFFSLIVCYVYALCVCRRLSSALLIPFEIKWINK